MLVDQRSDPGFVVTPALELLAPGRELLAARWLRFHLAQGRKKLFVLESWASGFAETQECLSTPRSCLGLWLPTLVATPHRLGRVGQRECVSLETPSNQEGCFAGKRLPGPSREGGLVGGLACFPGSISAACLSLARPLPPQGETPGSTRHTWPGQPKCWEPLLPACQPQTRREALQS